MPTTMATGQDDGELAALIRRAVEPRPPTTCTATDRVLGDGTARRCTVPAEEPGVHCAAHGRQLAVLVQQYKRGQAELCEGTGASWQAIAEWVDAQTDAGRLRRTARGLARNARQRLAVAVRFFYADPAGYTEELDAAADVQHTLRSFGATAWPDARVVPDTGHTFAVKKALALARLARARADVVAEAVADRAGAGGGEAAGGSRWCVLSTDTDTDTDDDAQYIDIYADDAPAAAHESRRHAPAPERPKRVWAAWERAAGDTYWYWRKHVAPKHPYNNLFCERLFELVVGMRRAYRADQPAGGTAPVPVAKRHTLVMTLSMVESIGAPHAGMIGADVCWRQVVDTARGLVPMLIAHFRDEGRPEFRARVQRSDPTLVATLAACSALSDVALRALAATRPGRRHHPLAGTIAARACARAVLAVARGMPIALRGVVASVLMQRHDTVSDLGAVVIAAACVGLCPEASDPDGLAWWTRLGIDFPAVMDELTLATAVCAAVSHRVLAARPPPPVAKHLAHFEAVLDADLSPRFAPVVRLFEFP